MLGGLASGKKYNYIRLLSRPSDITGLTPAGKSAGEQVYVKKRPETTI
jgi:hypothetical protein